MDVALVAVAIPIPAMTSPEKLAGLRPVVCLLPEPGGCGMLRFVVSSSRGAANPLLELDVDPVTRVLRRIDRLN